MAEGSLRAREGIDRCALVGVFALRAGAAFGDEPSEADALFEQGRAMMSQGKVAPACQAFAASLRLEDALGTLLNLAYCHEQEGKLPEAWHEYGSARNRAAAQHEERRARFSEQQLAGLEKRLAFVSVDLDAVAPQASVLVDGLPADRARIVDRFPLLPGDCRIEVRAPGYRAWSRTLRLGPGGSPLRVAVPPLDRNSAVAVPAPISPQAKTRRTWGYVVGPAGLASVATGAYFGVRTLRTKDKADQDCVGNACHDPGLELYADARRYATISTVTIGAGAAAIGASAWLLLFDHDATAAATPDRSAAVSARISRDLAGVQVTGAW